MNKNTFAFQATDTDLHSKQMILEGELVIRNAAIIKQELLSALSNSQNLELLLRNVIKADMAFLQLLVALKKSASAAKKSFNISIDESECMRASIENSGLRSNLLIDKRQN